MNKKTIYLVVAVIVVVLVVGVAGVMLLNGNGTNTNPTSTPTPSPAPTTIIGANIVQFVVDDSSAQLLTTYTAKNFNTSTEILRVDMNLGAAGNYSYIIDLGAQKSYASTDAGATWTASTDFSGDCTNYATPYYSYVSKIAEQGNTADFAYSSSIQISCIAVNPTIADSFFATS